MEAREFARMLGRNGHTIAELRAVIAIDRETLADMREWERLNPQIAPKLRRIVRYRERVLAEFEKLLAGELGN
jgi:hypothetical protein